MLQKITFCMVATKPACSSDKAKNKLGQTCELPPHHEQKDTEKPRGKQVILERTNIAVCCPLKDIQTFYTYQFFFFSFITFFLY